ncbi:MAG: YraN family protein [Clostridiales bacterium]|jgi:putative endonuclease|nr:YraN family protein [Clostridiales bacterium]
MSSLNKYEAGQRGQATAEAYLRENGYEILHKNYRLRTGEIDLIARTGTYIVFIEVKFRTGTAFGFPSESVNNAKQQKIISTALHFIAASKSQNQDFRFDVIEVLEKNNRIIINHIENAFYGV